VVSGQHHSEQSHLAAEAHHAGLGWRAWPIWPGSWARKPDGDDLEELGATLRGWAIRLAMAADNPRWCEDLTGRRWGRRDPPGPT
jgi:hypothetical protein